ncbi:MAG: DUF2442 domain-containing protein [Candidatus Omnitrophica bacterium]|nr:DUF2442 domain-containing protein [Candidatus Omnitrophota bacterium]
MVRLIAAKPLPQYTVWLKYDDGVEGKVDLSHLVGKGVFAVWKDDRAFEQVRIGDGGELLWGDTLDLCPNALYLRLTGKSPEQLFPTLQQVHA